MRPYPHHIGYLLLLPVLLATTPVQAERMFKWVDDEGKIHYSDRVPPQHSKRERREYDVSGRTVRVYERAKTPEEKAEAARLAAIEEQKQRVELLVPGLRALIPERTGWTGEAGTLP